MSQTMTLSMLLAVLPVSLLTCAQVLYSTGMYREVSTTGHTTCFKMRAGAAWEDAEYLGSPEYILGVSLS